MKQAKSLLLLARGTKLVYNNLEAMVAEVLRERTAE